MKTRGLLALLALAISLWGTGVVPTPNALGEPKSSKGSQDAKKPGKKKGDPDRTVKRALRMEEIEIYGDVEKPKTMFVIPRAALRFNRRDQEKDFTNEILDPVTKEWVEDTQRWRGAVPSP